MVEPKLSGVFCAPLHIHLEHNVQTGKVFKTLGTVLCKLMTKNVQEHSKKKKKKWKWKWKQEQCSP